MSDTSDPRVTILPDGDAILTTTEENGATLHRVFESGESFRVTTWGNSVSIGHTTEAHGMRQHSVADIPFALIPLIVESFARAVGPFTVTRAATAGPIGDEYRHALRAWFTAAGNDEEHDAAVVVADVLGSLIGPEA